VKRVIALIISLLLIFSVAACDQTNTDKQGPDAAGGHDAGSGSTGTDGGQDTVMGQEPGAVLSVKVMDVDGGSFLAASMEEGANGADIYMVDTGRAELLDKNGAAADISALKAGMFADIYYDGTVMESFPMQLGSVRSVRINNEGDDIAGLYMKVINDLYKVDPGLNSDIECIAFDLSKTTNLTETEKTALVYMAKDELGMETFRATYEELYEQGYINKERYVFETGLLYIIEVESENEKSFVFDAQKWRGGDGAYFFLDCTAKRDKNGWSYTIGSEAIS
jgi:hypothetical protein